MPIESISTHHSLERTHRHVASMRQADHRWHWPVELLV